MCSWLWRSILYEVRGATTAIGCWGVLKDVVVRHIQRSQAPCMRASADMSDKSALGRDVGSMDVVMPCDGTASIMSWGLHLCCEMRVAQRHTWSGCFNTPGLTPLASTSSEWVPACKQWQREILLLLYAIKA